MLPPSGEPEVVWHYTTGQGLLNILESKALWATQVSCLNDTSEYGFGSDILFSAFKRRSEQLNKDVYFSCLFDKIQKNMARKADHPYSLKAEWFVTCFSENGDDLSQWRGYGGGENGYALGFSVAELNRRQLLHKVFYPENTAFTDCVCEQINALHSLGISKAKPADPGPWTEAFLRQLGWVFLELGAVIKDPAFKGEREYRQVYRYTLEEIGNLRFKQKGSILSRHLCVQYPEFKQRSTRDLPLTHIRIGPSRNQKISENSLDLLLRQKGYAPNVKILCSSVPYRET